MIRILLVAVALLLGGCSLALADDEAGSSPPEQLCTTNADCGADATCRDGTCVGTDTIFATVLIETAVPNSPVAGVYAGTRFLRTMSGLPSGGGRLDLDLTQPTDVELLVSSPPCEDAVGELVPRQAGACPEGSSSSRTCSFDFRATPLEVILTPSERALGLSTIRYTTGSEGAKCSDAAPCEMARFALTVPAGEYDVYLHPDPNAPAPPEGICRIVPEISVIDVPGDAQLTVDYGLAPSSRLDVEVKWPLSGNDSAALEGWTLDMLDATSGRRISTIVPLGAPTVEGDTATYAATVDYVNSPPDGTAGSELVRLRPPEDVLGPTIVVERSALELFKGPALIDQLTMLPQPVQVEGQILTRASADDTSQLKSVGGAVTLIATELEGLPPGVLASFRRTVDVASAEDGLFRAELLPGRYRVRVVPPGDCSDVIPCGAGEVICKCPLAATEVTDFDVATLPAVQGGKTVELQWQTRVAGKVSTSSGAVVAGADVVALSAPQRPTALEVALGGDAFVPRASTGASDASGSFELYADAGSFNVSVRPESGKGLAWLVRPNVPVRAGGGSLDLEDLVLPLPVSYTGAVRVPGVADGYAIIPDATIRVYVPVVAGDPSSFVVQVAEATTDADGMFQLLLPTALEHPR